MGLVSALFFPRKKTIPTLKVLVIRTHAFSSPPTGRQAAVLQRGQFASTSKPRHLASEKPGGCVTSAELLHLSERPFPRGHMGIPMHLWAS